MKAKELAKILLENPDFDVDFSFADYDPSWFNLRTFKNIKVDDIGYSDKVIKLGGEEK